MAVKRFEKPGMVFAAWSLVLIIAFGALAATDAGMLRYARGQRAEDYRSHVEDAGMLLELHDFPGALAKVEAALSLAPKKPEPQVMLGHIHYRLQSWKRAIQAYEAALRLGSTDAGVRQNLVWSYIELQQYTSAAKLGEESMAAGIESPALSRYVAEAWFRDGAYAKAIPYLEVALRTWPKDLYLLERFRRSLVETGDHARAKRIAARMAEVGAALGRNPAQ